MNLFLNAQCCVTEGTDNGRAKLQLYNFLEFVGI
jgi:hypothetical protein